MIEVLRARVAPMRRISAFSKDRSGTATVEFVICLPFILVMIAFVGSFGELVSQREQLDSATFDATRLLSRAPAGWENSDGTASVDGDGNAVPAIQAHFQSEARALIAERMGVDLTGTTPNSATDPVRVSVNLRMMTTGRTMRTNFYLIELSATVAFDSPLLAIVAAFGLVESNHPEKFTMNAVQSARYVSAIPIGNEACPPADRAAGFCV
ncbi:MAG: TadE/TadG family type IV pilus assembly protein [Pseudomonadota bacterium]